MHLLSRQAVKMALAGKHLSCRKKRLAMRPNCFWHDT
jgi:RNA-binding protein YlmH